MGTESMCKMRGCNNESAGGLRAENEWGAQYPLCASDYAAWEAHKDAYAFTYEEVYAR